MLTPPPQPLKIIGSTTCLKHASQWHEGHNYVCMITSLYKKACPFQCPVLCKGRATTPKSESDTFVLCRLLRRALKHWLRHWYCAASGKLIAAHHRQLLTATAVHALRDYAQQQQAKYAQWRVASQHRKRSVFKALRRSVADAVAVPNFPVPESCMWDCANLSPR